MSVRLRDLAVFARRVPHSAADGAVDPAGKIRDDLEPDLPGEEFGDDLEDLDDALVLYRTGSKPRCEEVEYLQLVRDAIDRIEGGH